MSSANPVPTPSATPSLETARPTRLLGLLLRIFWMIAGNAALALSGLYIAQQHGGLFSVAAVCYGIIAAMLIASRYTDIVRYAGTTAYGQPATLTDWRRYAAGMVAISAAGWLAAHGIAYLGTR